MRRLFLLLGMAVASNAFAEDGIRPDQILLGQACVLKGPSSSLGDGMMKGLRAYFLSINAKGGVKGRKFELKTVNDNYEPETAESMVAALIDTAKVFLIVGQIGTPTAKVAAPVCEAKKVPYIAPFTGAELLRNPFRKYVINVRASYYQEMERLAQVLVDKRGFKKIACFYQDDSFGTAGLEGIKIALKRRGLELVSLGKYPRNTNAIQEGLDSIAVTNPDAVVMVGTYKPCATFIKAAKANPSTKGAIFANISFVGTDALLKELGSEGDGTIISQVVPFPWDASRPVVAEYQAAMKAAGFEADIGFVSLEGFIAGKFVAQVFEKMEGEPTRELFLDTIQKVGNFDLGGLKLSFGAEDHQGMDEVFLTIFKGGKVEPLAE